MSDDIDRAVRKLELEMEARRLAIETLKSIRGTEKPSTQAFYDNRNGTKLSQLREFVRGHGSMKRETILKDSGLNPGTVRTYLNRNNFNVDENGNWSVKE